MSDSVFGFTSKEKIRTQVYQLTMLKQLKGTQFLGPLSQAITIIEHVIDRGQKDKVSREEYFVELVENFPGSLYELFEDDGNIIYDLDFKRIVMPFSYETDSYRTLSDDHNPPKTGILEIEDAYIFTFYVAGNFEFEIINIIASKNQNSTNQLLNDGITRFLEIEAAKTKAKLKPGIYKAKKVWTEAGYKLKLQKRKNFPQIPIVHETYESIKEDVRIFFGDTLLKLYDRYNIPPMRKILLTGPPGTGKSSMAMAISDAWKDKLGIFYVSEMEVLKLLADSLYRFDVPGIIIIEDFDQFYEEQTNTTELLNFLDGADVPTTKNGLYFIFTSNVPKDLDPRLSDRPGRIDRMVTVDKLKGQDALTCLLNYLPDSMEVSEEFKNEMLTYFHLHEISGAEVKAIVIDAIKSNISSGKEDLTAQDLIKAEENLRETLEKARKLNFLDEDEDEDDEAYEKTAPTPGGRKKKKTRSWKKLKRKRKKYYTSDEVLKELKSGLFN